MDKQQLASRHLQITAAQQSLHTQLPQISVALPLLAVVHQLLLQDLQMA